MKGLLPILLGVIAVILLCLTPGSNVSADYIGGYASQKLIARQGTSNSYLIFGSTTQSVALDIGAGPTGTTTSGSPNPGTTVTLAGNLSDMNNFDSVSVCFEWGSTTAYGNTTAVGTMNATGNYTADITGFASNSPIYFRFVAYTDGTSYGDQLVVNKLYSYTGMDALTLIIPAVALLALILLPGILVFAGVKQVSPRLALVMYVLAALAIVMAAVILPTLVDNISTLRSGAWS